MKTILLTTLFLICVSAAATAQDDKQEPKRNTQEIMVIREVVCPDCQGWGWLLSKGYNLNVSKSRSTSSGSSLNLINQSTFDVSLVKTPCYLCFGKGYVHLKEPKK